MTQLAAVRQLIVCLLSHELAVLGVGSACLIRLLTQTVVQYIFQSSNCKSIDLLGLSAGYDGHKITTERGSTVDAQ